MEKKTKTIWFIMARESCVLISKYFFFSLFFFLFIFFKYFVQVLVVSDCSGKYIKTMTGKVKGFRRLKTLRGNISSRKVKVRIEEMSSIRKQLTYGVIYDIYIYMETLQKLKRTYW